MAASFKVPHEITMINAKNNNELRSGWLLILASAVGLACSPIVLPYYTIGALVGPLTAEFGWARAEVQISVLFSAGIGAITALLIGVLSDRYGPRALVLPGLFGISCGFFVAASANSLGTLYLAYTLMALLGAGATPITWTRAIAASFVRLRGLALGLTLTGTGICAMFTPALATWMVQEFGWRGAYIGLGLLPLLIAAPLVLVGFKPKSIRPAPSADNTPAEQPWGLTLREAMHSYKFWVLCVSTFCVYMAVSGISPNLIPSLTDKGLDPLLAAKISGLFGFAIILGRLVVGALIDRLWAPGVAVGALVLPVIGCFILAGDPSLAWIRIAVLLIGFAAGAELDLMAFLVARYFGLRHYSKIYSILYALLAVGSGTAPMLFASVYDRTKSYDISFLTAATLFTLSALSVLAMGRYPKQTAPLKESSP